MDYNNKGMLKFRDIYIHNNQLYVVHVAVVLYVIISVVHNMIIYDNTITIQNIVYNKHCQVQQSEWIHMN